MSCWIWKKNGFFHLYKSTFKKSGAKLFHLFQMFKLRKKASRRATDLVKPFFKGCPEGRS